MSRLLLTITALLCVGLHAAAEDAVDESTTTEEAQSTEARGDGIEKPKTMSGMSILGNEEAPKSLVIIPWKSSELGDDLGLSDTLDDRARPVDKEVFLRELRFYEIRSRD
ncbi:MAG: hypothetical protein OEO82_03750 [Gammaproteobacteria bacterium]|nr:hypothetical protein [Gammaproteobacteria bacterium]